MAAYAIRAAGLRKRVREMYDYSQRMDVSDPDHRANFHRQHVSIWDSVTGPELGHAEQILRKWPARTERDIERINQRLFELRNHFLRPMLEALIGDMPEAHKLGLFTQSRMEPFYELQIPGDTTDWMAARPFYPDVFMPEAEGCARRAA